jgi:hypothetical protein
MTSRSPFDSFGAQYAWDSTSLKWATSCQRYYAFAMLLNAEGEKSVHLIFGGHYARALETYHKFRAEEIDHETAVYLVTQQTLIESWIHNLDPMTKARLPGTGHAQLFESSSKTREALIRSIIWYLEEFQHSEWKTHILSNGKPAVELSFTIELSGDILYCGHIDRVVENNGDLYPQDQKSTGTTVSDYYIRQFDTDIQMSGYSFASQIILGSPMKGVMIDATQILANATAFYRGFTPRTTDSLNEWRHEALITINNTRLATQEFRQTNNLSAFRPNFTACGNYGGCPYRPVCAMTPSLRLRYLKSNYNQRLQWNPLEPR